MKSKRIKRLLSLSLICVLLYIGCGCRKSEQTSLIEGVTSKSDTSLKTMNPKTLELTLFGIAANRFDFYYGDFIKAYPDHRVIFRLGVARGVDTIIVEDDNFPGAVIAFASLYGEMDDKDFHVEVIRIKVGDIFPEYIGKTKDELRELGFSMTDLFPVSPMFPASPEAYYRTKEENITDSSDYMDYEKVGKWIGRIDAYYVISFFDNEFLSEDNFVYILPPTAFH